MRNKTRKDINKKTRELMDFERNPPRCKSCICFIKEIKAEEGIRFKPARCSLGKFAVEEHSICNKWKDRSGNIIDNS